MAAKKSYSKKRNYSKKSRGPSRAELMRTEIEEEILKFWRELMEAKPGGFTRPWVLNVRLAESAGAYLNHGTRQPYKGSFNQWIIAYATRDYTSELAPLAITQSQLCSALGVKKFYETKACEAGVRSNISIFRPNKGTRYVLENGLPWEAPDGERRRPTPEEIERFGLQRREVVTGFGASAAYSMADLYPHLPEDLQAKIDELAEKRRGIGRNLNPEDSFEQFIKQYTQDMLDRQGIKYETGNNRAFYDPTKDSIAIPDNVQFKNPLQYLSTVAHELAHSTMHLNGRSPIVKGDTLGYAIEEVIAETTSAMVIKQVESGLDPEFRNRADVKAMFEDYYLSSQDYVRDYGSKTEFLKMIDKIENVHKQEEGDSKKNTLKKIMTNITSALATLEQTIEPGERLEAKEKNLEELRRRVRERRNNPEPTPA